ncbi:hypothetical protein GCM10009839_55310 [Catenulispora yoronensis]|uniref:Uncharacterized protein n=1 Tax=Catenulispora yoronensis TaxID=450799 RepID=A0ABP5GDK2_9ACTN
MTAIIEQVSAEIGQGLFSKGLALKLVKRVHKDWRLLVPLTDELAEQIVDQTAVFLAAIAHADGPLTPSTLVDQGWHAFVIHTRDYREYCMAKYGSFIDHNPTDNHRAAEPVELLGRTTTAIEAAGYHVIPELWKLHASCDTDSTGCHCQGCGADCDGDDFHG